MQSGNEWKVKHDVLQSRLEEAAGIQAKYIALESQYAALALLVKDSDASAAVKVRKINTLQIQNNFSDRLFLSVREVVSLYVMVSK